MKVLRGATKLSMELFGAGEGAIVTIGPGWDLARILLSLPEQASWDRALLTAFLRGEPVRVPGELMLARIRRHGRMWGSGRQGVRQGPALGRPAGILDDRRAGQ